MEVWKGEVFCWLPANILEVVKSPEAKKSGILLMFNKIDLFRTKFKEEFKAWQKAFPEYQGGL